MDEIFPNSSIDWQDMWVKDFIHKVLVSVSVPQITCNTMQNKQTITLTYYTKLRVAFFF